MTAVLIGWLATAMSPQGWAAMLYAGLLVSFVVFGRMAAMEDDDR